MLQGKLAHKQELNAILNAKNKAECDYTDLMSFFLLISQIANMLYMAFIIHWQLNMLAKILR